VSQENVEIVRAVYEGFVRGEAWIAVFHPDITLDLSRRRIDPATFRGHEGVRAFLEAQRDAWRGQRIEPEEYIDLGACIVVPIRFVSTGRASGIDVVARAAWVWEVEDGLAVRGTVYQSKAEALEAVGLQD
jgi:ketosteroid isomerase-like protein